MKLNSSSGRGAGAPFCAPASDDPSTIPASTMTAGIDDQKRI
jgi:hypothetical protein